MRDIRGHLPCVDSLQARPSPRNRKWPLSTDLNVTQATRSPQTWIPVFPVTLLSLTHSRRWPFQKRIARHPCRSRFIQLLASTELLHASPYSHKEMKSSIPIAQELETQIQHHFKQHGLFSKCLNSFDKALAESRLPVPAGQSSHVLRHTFSSHFIMNGGNILTLQKILGHSSLAMTVRYSHLAPDHLQDAVRFGLKNIHTLLT